MGRDRHNWSFLESRNLADQSRGGEPINNRKAQVHQYQVWQFGLGYFHGFFAVARFDDLIASHLQQPSHHEPIIFRILDEQNFGWLFTTHFLSLSKADRG